MWQSFDGFLVRVLGWIYLGWFSLVCFLMVWISGNFRPSIFEHIFSTRSAGYLIFVLPKWRPWVFLKSNFQNFDCMPPVVKWKKFMQKSKYVLVDVLADIGTGFCLDCLVWYFWDVLWRARCCHLVSWFPGFLILMVRVMGGYWWFDSTLKWECEFLTLKWECEFLTVNFRMKC